MQYYKRLIEVDFPVKKASASGRKEKDIRSGHPWQLHIWWARRPWGVCRSVALASLLPAPTDVLCPKEFLEQAPLILSDFYDQSSMDTPEKLQDRLLNFVGEISVWEQWANSKMMNTAQKLIKILNSTGLVAFDPFSGYGAIPGETARLGCYSYAFDLNPVAILCMKTLLEAVPCHKSELVQLYERGAEFIKLEADKKLSKYYPQNDQKKPIAWLWARTVRCEGPLCGAEIPLISQTIIIKGKIKTWIEITGDKKTKQVKIDIKSGERIPDDLIKPGGGGNALCPVCNYLTSKVRVKFQAKHGEMGQRLFGVALSLGGRLGKKYVVPNPEDFATVELAQADFKKVLLTDSTMEITEKFPFHDTRGFTAGLYGISKWGDIFSPRQKLTLYTLGDILHSYYKALLSENKDPKLVKAVVTALGLSLSHSSIYQNNLAYWGQDHLNYCYKGMAISMKWDWAEANPLTLEYVGGLEYTFKQGLNSFSSLYNLNSEYISVRQMNATRNILPTDSGDLFFTDPPYYDVVPYADLSDLPYVWLKRYLKNIQPELVYENLTPKADQVVVNPYSVADGRGEQSPEKYTEKMTLAFAESRRVLKPGGIGAIVFAHKGTDAWESLLSSVLNAGFIITGSWPIDTEKGSRMRANNSAVLSSSIHLIVRPREYPDGRLITNNIGNWSDVIRELPLRLKSWMPRLANEGIIGADAIFACLGPALEIFSKFSSVEKPNGDVVSLKEYLEKVWAAISQVALDMVFMGGNAESFEEDARLTAMWLWTLKSASDSGDKEDQTEMMNNGPSFSLDYGTVHKISVSLGIEVEKLKSVVEIKGDVARLFSVRERTDYLFNQSHAVHRQHGINKPKLEELNLFTALEEQFNDESTLAHLSSELLQTGDTTLNRLHQAMILFSQGRTESLKSLLIDQGVGKDEKFWKLAQALNALYPSNSDERRWVEAVQSYRKSLGY